MEKKDGSMAMMMSYDDGLNGKQNVKVSSHPFFFHLFYFSPPHSTPPIHTFSGTVESRSQSKLQGQGLIDASLPRRHEQQEHSLRRSSPQRLRPYRLCRQHGLQ